MHRHSEFIKSQIPDKVCDNRRVWSNYENFSVMYDLVYKELVRAKIARPYIEPIYFNKEGKIVSCKRDAAGLPVDLELLHARYVIFVDKVGNNTNMKSDNQPGNERYIGSTEDIAKDAISTKDARFTVLGFTAGTGEPIMCAIIIATPSLHFYIQKGIDVRISKKNGGYRNNCGPGKRYPGGPTCKFNNKDVPCFICCLPKGSITSELLRDMLARMDRLNLFSQEDGGPEPLIILDGHGSRFGLSYLRYTNDPAHIWRSCLGLPYGTAFWQLGDSTEQNELWKIALTKAKRELVRFKRANGFNIQLLLTDIIPLVNKAWKESFAKVNSNKKAILERGWGPLNRYLLTNREVLKTKQRYANSLLKRIMLSLLVDCLSIVKFCWMMRFSNCRKRKKPKR